MASILLCAGVLDCGAARPGILVNVPALPPITTESTTTSSAHLSALDALATLCPEILIPTDVPAGNDPRGVHEWRLHLESQPLLSCRACIPATSTVQGKDLCPPPRFCCQAVRPSSILCDRPVRLLRKYTLSRPPVTEDMDYSPRRGRPCDVSQYLGLPANGTTIHAMGTTATMVQLGAVAVLGGPRLVIQLKCAADVRGEL